MKKTFSCSLADGSACFRYEAQAKAGKIPEEDHDSEDSRHTYY